MNLAKRMKDQRIQMIMAVIVSLVPPVDADQVLRIFHRTQIGEMFITDIHPQGPKAKAFVSVHELTLCQEV